MGESSSILSIQNPCVLACGILLFLRDTVHGIGTSGLGQVVLQIYQDYKQVLLGS